MTISNDLINIIKQRDESQQEANSHGAMESRYDTFKEEAQYLVSCCNEQIEKLNKNILSIFIINNPSLNKKMEKIGAGSLVTVSESHWVFITTVFARDGLQYK